MKKSYIRHTIFGRWLAFVLCLALCMEGSSLSVLAVEEQTSVEEISAEEQTQNVTSVSGNGTEDDESDTGTDGSVGQADSSDADSTDDATISGNTLSTVSGNGTENMIDEEREALVMAAKEAFAQLLQQKTLMALLYHADTYRVRRDADADSDTVATLPIGTTLYLRGVQITEDDVWYQVQFWLDGSEQTGFVQDYYLAYADEDWLSWEETYLQPLADADSDGLTLFSTETEAVDTSDIDAFPTAYQSALRSLKASHPNWTFVPMNTGLDFNTAVSSEKGDKSLIQKTDSNVAKGWVGSACSSESGWYYATTDAIAYYMNPTNFLTETYIFQFEQLTFNSSYHSAEAVQSFLNNTFMKGTLPDDSQNRTYAQAFYEIGKSRTLSPIHLASRVYQEQGSGTSGLISGTYSGYEGYYNFFNVNATGSSTAEKIQKGLAYAKEKGWNTRYKSLDGGAATIGNNYILKGQDTIYLEKFNVNKNSANAIYTHQYMQNIQAPASEAASTKKMYSNAGSLNAAFVFKIPVFKNMSSSADSDDASSTVESISLTYDGTAVTADTTIQLRRSDTVVTDTTGLDSAEKKANTDQASLQATITPSDAAQTVSWSTSNSKIATVTADAADSTRATITAKAAGEVTITAKASDKTATCKVQVIAPIYSLSIENLNADGQESTTLYAGQSVNLTAEYEPKNTTSDTQITWSSSDETVATVQNGKVTALSPGTVTITASTAAVAGGTKKYTATHKIVVKGCNVTFLDSAGDKLTEVSGVGYGETLSADVIKQASAAAESKNSDLFIGWYTGKNGSGSRFDETTRIYQEQVTLYAYYEEQGKGFYVLPVGDQTYTGSAIRPEPQVYNSVTNQDGTKKLIRLVQGQDYTVSYQNNKNVNEGSGKTPTITIKGKGNYSGTQYVTFNIVAKALTDSDITAADITAAYTGKTIKSAPQILRDGKKLSAKTDYTVTYPQTGAGAYEKAGTYSVVVTGKGGYTGTITVSETITYSVLMSKVSVTKIPNQTYKSELAGTGIVPASLTVKYKGETLTESTDGGKTGDYTVSYQNNTAAGTATATITAVEGSRFAGSKSVTYKIVGPSLAKAQVTGVSDKVYTGNDADVMQSGYVLTCEGVTLAEGTDYTVSYSGISGAGTAKITFSGKGGYTGKLTRSYKIAADSLATDAGGLNTRISMKYYLQGEEESSARTITSLSQITAPYVKGGSKPVVVLYYDDVKLVSGQDYTVKYAGNTAVTTADTAENKLPRITVTGKGNFKGSLSGTFQITDGLFSGDNGKISMTAQDVVYQEKAGAYQTTVTLKDVDGKKLTAGKDYEKDLRCTYDQTVTCTSADGSIVARRQGDAVEDTDIVPAGTVIRVTATGMGAYAGKNAENASLSCTYRIVTGDIAKTTVKVVDQAYLNGQKVTLKATDLSVTTKAGTALVEGRDYVIDEDTYVNNTDKGKASVTIRGIGDYGGEKKVSFTIGSKNILWWKTNY